MRFQDDDLLIEITRAGDWQRVAIVEAGSGREVVVHGPAATPSEILVTTARHRLRATQRPSAPAAGDGILA